jgi:6-phosphogluconolactonase
MTLKIYKDADELSNSASEWIADLITKTLQKQDRFTMALSGGSTPQKLHQVLARNYKDKIDWSRLHIFWGDERAVPFEDERNNARMAYETLLNHVPVPASQIHVMRTDIEPETSAKQYEEILHQYFDNHDTTFDLVLLGMGDDGHTLSLFPGTEIVHEKKAWVKAFYLPPQSMYRISLTAPVTNRSATIAFLTTGKNKASTLRSVLKGELNPEVYPSQLIKPEQGELYWFVDEAAAAALKD